MHIMNVIWGLFGRTSGRGRGQESNEGWTVSEDIESLYDNGSWIPH
jgi:hypothetical protein